MNISGSLNKTTSNFRQDHEPPEAISKLGWHYHHLGIPTDTPRPDEVYLEKLGMYVSGFKTSPFGVEWMRFEENSPISELIRTVPHIAFEVDDIETALKSVNSDAEITSPSEGVRVAMLIHNGAPIELIEFSQNK
ncbi:MAG: VOC family protein [bacterium]|nr:VOC family protein [bacterium]